MDFDEMRRRAGIAESISLNQLATQAAEKFPRPRMKDRNKNFQRHVKKVADWMRSQTPDESQHRDIGTHAAEVIRGGYDK